MRIVGWISTILIAIAGTVVVQSHFNPRESGRSPTEPLSHRSLQGQPTIEQVKRLSQLVSLRVPISDVQVSELTGYTGGLRLVLAVHGDVEIATDLSNATFSDIDNEQQTAILILPRPHSVRPRLNHEKTRIVEITRSGMWSIVGGQAGESTLTNAAMQKAQSLLIDAADTQDLQQQACEHTQVVIREFFAAMGWSVAVQWEDAEPSPQAASSIQSML